jgi:2-oxoglutarate ferredoxin oxidoreductase subunit alpha
MEVKIKNKKSKIKINDGANTHTPINLKGTVLMSGNEAVAEAAIRAGCRAYFGYPITPQNEVPAYMSWRMHEVGGAFIQAESELAAINMVFGASVVGVRTMTSSSSPGISLMQESISYMAGAELPAVILNVMRGGPGLGSIGPSQADYFQATRGGGHGDYRTIVLAPHTVPEAVELTKLAFDLADRYRNPVMILMDGVLGQMMEAIPDWGELKEPPKVVKKWALTGAKDRPAQRICSLLLKDGALEEQNWKMHKKYEQVNTKETRVELYNTKDADFIIVAYGISARLCKSVVDKLRKEKIKIGLVRPVTLWPFPGDSIPNNVKKIFVVELSCGQLLEDVQLATKKETPICFYGRPGGVFFSVDEIYNKIKSQILNQKSK